LKKSLRLKSFLSEHTVVTILAILAILATGPNFVLRPVSVGGGWLIGLAVGGKKYFFNTIWHYLATLP